MKKIITLLLIIAAVAAGYFYWLDINKIETIKISSANAENMKLLFAVMQDKGMTDKNKIKLDVVYSDPAEAERKMVDRSNGVEVSVFNPIALAATNQQKRINLRAFVGVHNSYHAILVKKDSTYKKLEDLKGAKIAIRPKVSAAYSAFSVGMQTAGLNLEKDFKLTFGSIPQNVASLKNGEVDATFLNIFETSKLLAAGQYREINDLDQKWFDEMKFPMPFVDFAAHEDWIKENPKKVKRLKMTTLEALEYIHNSPNLAYEYKDLLGLKTDEEIKLVKNRIDGSYPTAWNPDIRERVLEKAFNLGFLKELPKEKLFLD